MENSVCFWALFLCCYECAFLCDWVAAFSPIPSPCIYPFSLRSPAFSISHPLACPAIDYFSPIRSLFLCLSTLKPPYNWLHVTLSSTRNLFCSASFSKRLYISPLGRFSNELHFSRTQRERGPTSLRSPHYLSLSSLKSPSK